MPRRGAVRFNLGVTAPTDLDELSPAELKALVLELLGEVAEQKRLIAQLRDENARLKGLKNRPRIKPSGMEKASEAKRSGKRNKRRGRGKLTPRVRVEEQVIKAAVPAGSRFKGYETFVVQELVLRAQVMLSPARLSSIGVRLPIHTSSAKAAPVASIFMPEMVTPSSSSPMT